jgi:uncharacterized protein YciU (UPF0263 family)
LFSLPSKSDYKYQVSCISEDSKISIEGSILKIKNALKEMNYRMNSNVGLESMAEKAVFLFDNTQSARILTVEQIEIIDSLQRETESGFQVEYKTKVEVSISLLDKDQRKFLDAFRTTLFCKDLYKDEMSKESPKTDSAPRPLEENSTEFNAPLY